MLDEDASADQIWAELKRRRAALLAAGSRTARAKALDAMEELLGDVAAARGRLLHKWRAWGWVLLAVYHVVESEMQGFLQLPGVRADPEAGAAVVGAKRKRPGKSAAAAAAASAPRIDFWAKLLRELEALHSGSALPTLHLDNNGRKLLDKLFAYAVVVISRMRSSDPAFERVAEPIDALAWRTVSFVAQHQVYCAVLSHDALQTVLEFALSALDDGDQEAEGDSVARRDALAARARFVRLAIKNYPFDLQDGLPVLVECLTGWFHLVRPENVLNTVWRAPTSAKGETVHRVAPVVLDALTSLCKRYHSCVGALLFKDPHLFDVLHFIQRTWKTYKFGAHDPQMEFILQFIQLYGYNAGRGFKVHGVHRMDICKELSVFARALLDFKDLIELVTYRKPSTRGSSFTTWAAASTVLDVSMHTEDTIVLYLACAADVVHLHDRLISEMVSSGTNTSQSTTVLVAHGEEPAEQSQALQIELLWERVVENARRAPQVESMILHRGQPAFVAIGAETSSRDQGVGVKSSELSVEELKRLGVGWMMVLLSLLSRHGKFYVSTRIADVMVILTELGDCLVATEIRQVQYYALLSLIQVADLQSKNFELCGDVLDEAWAGVWTNLLRPELPYLRVTGETSLWQEHAGDAVLVLLNYFVASKLIPVSMIEAQSTTLWSLSALQPSSARIPAATVRRGSTPQVSGTSVAALILLASLLNVLELPEAASVVTPAEDGDQQDSESSAATVTDLTRSSAVPSRAELLRCVFENLRSYATQDDLAGVGLDPTDLKKDAYMPMVFASVLGAFRRSGQAKNRSANRIFLPTLLQRLTSPQQFKSDAPAAELSGFGVAFSLSNEGLNYLTHPETIVDRFRPNDFSPMIRDALATFSSSDNSTTRAVRQWSTFERVRIPPSLMNSIVPTAVADFGNVIVESPRVHAISISNSTKAQLHSEITNQFQLIFRELSSKLAAAKSDPVQLTRLLVTLERVGLILALLFADLGDQSDSSISAPSLQLIPLLKCFLDIFTAYFNPETIARTRLVRSAAPLITQLLTKFHSFILALQSLDALASCSHPSSVQLNFRILPELRLSIRQIVAAVEECLALATEASRSGKDGDRPTTISYGKPPRSSAGTIPVSGAKADPMDIETNPSDKGELLLSDATQMTINLWCFRVVFLLKKEAGIEVVKKHVGDLQLSPDFLLAVAVVAAGVPVADSLDVFVRLVNHGVDEAAGDSKKMQWHHSFSGAFFVSQVLTALTLAGQAHEKRKAIHHEEIPASLTKCAHQFLAMSFSHPLRLHVSRLRAAEVKCLEVFFRLSSDGFPDFGSAPLDGIIDASLHIRVESARALQTLLYMYPDGQSSICGEISSRLNGRKPADVRAKARAQNKSADMCRTDALCWFICAASFEDVVPDAVFFYLRVAADERRAMSPSMVHSWTSALADAYDYPSVRALVDDHFGFLWWSYVSGRRAMAERAAMKYQHDADRLSMKELIEMFPIGDLLGQQHRLDYRGRLQYFITKMDEIFPLSVLASSIVQPDQAEADQRTDFELAREFAQMIGETNGTASAMLLLSVNDNIASDLVAFSFIFQASGLNDLQRIAEVQYAMADKMGATASLSVSNHVHIASKLAAFAVLGVTDPRWIPWSQHVGGTSEDDSDDESVFLEGGALWTQSILCMKQKFEHFRWRENDLAKVLCHFYVMLLRSQHFGPRAERAVDCFQSFVRENQNHLAANAILQRLVLVICFQAIKHLTVWPRKRIARTLTFLVRELCEVFMKTPDSFGKYFPLVVEEIGDILLCSSGATTGGLACDFLPGTILHLDEDNQGHLEWVVFAICNDMGSLGKFASDVNAVPTGVSACLDKLSSLIDTNRESFAGVDKDAMKTPADMTNSSLSSQPASARSSDYIKKFIEAETKSDVKFYNPRHALDSFGHSLSVLNTRGRACASPPTPQDTRPTQQRQSGAIVRLSKLSKSIQSLRQSGQPRDHNELMQAAGKLAHILLHLNLTSVDDTAGGRHDDVVVGIANVLGDVGALDSNEFDLSPGADVEELSRLFKRRFRRGALGEMSPSLLPVLHEQLLSYLCSLVFERKVVDANVISEALTTLRSILSTEAGKLASLQCKDRELKQFLEEFDDSAGADWSSSLEEFLGSGPQDGSSTSLPDAPLADLWRQSHTLGFQQWIRSISASLAEETPDPFLRACGNLVTMRTDMAVFVFPFLMWTILSSDNDMATTPAEQHALERKVQTRRFINEGVRWILKQEGDAGDSSESWRDANMLATSRPPAEVIQTIIHTINFLRETEKLKFMAPRPKEPKGIAGGNQRKRRKAAYGCMVDVDLLDVARAAVSVKMPFSAMQYVEMWIEHTNGGMLPLSHRKFDSDASGDIIRRILVDAYKFDSNVDGIYGVSDGRTFNSQLVTYSQENDYASTLPLYDVALQFPEIHHLQASGAGARATEGMLLSLQKLGYNHLLEGYMNAVLAQPSQRSKRATASINEYKYERAWKNMQWNAVMTDVTDVNTSIDSSERDHQPVYTPHRTLFQSLKATAHRDFSGLSEVTSAAKARILQSLQVSLGGFEATQESYRALACLQSIREIEEVVQAMDGGPNGGSYAGAGRDMRTGFAMANGLQPSGSSQTRTFDSGKFFESWQNRHGQIHKDFDTIENLLAVEEVLIKIADTSTSASSALSKLYLSLAARSRKANRIAVAYSALMRLEVLHDRGQLSVFDRLQWKIQRAKLLWSQQEGRSAIWTAKRVSAEINGYLSQRLTPTELTDLLLLHVGVLTVTGKWVAAQRSESSQVIVDNYFKCATAIVEGMGATEIGGRIGRAAKAHLALAEYMGEMYHQVNARVTSREWIAGKKVAEARARELAACKAMRRELQDANRQHILGLEREVKYDKEERASVEYSVEQFLTGALANYGKGLALSSKAELATVFKVLSLWFGNHSHAAVDSAMKTLVDTVPSYKFVPLSYQIISRIGSGGGAATETTPGVYQDALSELVLKLCLQHPHHALIQLIALKNGGDVAGKNASAFRSNVGDAKSLKAMEYLDVLRKTELGELLEAQDALANLYIQLALFDTAEYQSKNIKQIRLVDVPVLTTGARMSSRDRFPNFDQCFREIRRQGSNRGCMPAVITLTIAPRADLDYSRVVRIHSFASTFSITDSGIHRPKILYCSGSNGLRVKQLVKGLDDMRQDLVIEQVFDAVNQFLKENEQTRQRNLRLVTYRVVPLSPAAGVLEWVDKTMPFGSYLTSRPSSRSGAHERYHPHEWRHGMCRQHLKTAVDKLKAYSEVEANFTPVFHHFFLEKFPDPATWYSRRLAYVRSVAVTSIVGYILGIGDRHAQNILIHEETAELVHIDFGVVFDQGMALFTPETVPFRLTRDMVDGMGVSGCDGVFSRCCEATLQLLRVKSASVVTILEVFVHDPLYRWMLSPLKALRIQKDDAAAATRATAPSSAVDEEEDDASNDAAARALLRVKQKLEGFEDPNGSALSIEGQVKHLILEAQNPSNLCRLFPGWAPWI